MYKLLNAQTGEQLGIVESPLFIKKSASGCYVGCQPGEAIGIAYKSVAYNLVGHEDIPEAATILPVEFESGDDMVALFGGNPNQTMAAAQLRRSMQMFVESSVTEESQMMEVADLYPTWEELLAAKKEFPAGKVFKWGENADGEPQLWSFISAYTPQEIYPPDKDISHYKKVGITEDGTPVWTQPLGATDAYKKGDVVSHNGKTWTSDLDGNVWEPGVYGWTEKK